MRNVVTAHSTPTHVLLFSILATSHEAQEDHRDRFLFNTCIYLYFLLNLKHLHTMIAFNFCLSLRATNAILEKRSSHLHTHSNLKLPSDPFRICTHQNKL